MTASEIACGNEILRGVVGSTVHGTAIEGQDDRDEMGVFVEPPENVCGLKPIDHYVHRTKPDGVRSGPGDLDLIMYSLRKFCRLAAQGNPTVLILLWLPSYITKTTIGDALVAMRKAFISQEAGKRFLGYLVSQKLKLRGQKAHTVNRPELVEWYGYDVKFAMHALRLGLQGAELLSRGRITLPVPEPDLTRLRAVRTGKFTIAEMDEMIEDAERHLRGLIDACDLVVDLDAIDQFMVTAHQEHWKQARNA